MRVAGILCLSALISCGTETPVEVEDPYPPVASYCGPPGWSAVSTIDQPELRFFPTAIWSGEELIIFGGVNVRDEIAAGGHAWAPATNTWRRLPDEGAPSKRLGHAAVWTGKEMIVWGGFNDLDYLSDGARYDPKTNQWRPMKSSLERGPGAVVWTGREMVAWSGGGQGNLQSGLRYDPQKDSWAPMSVTGAPAARFDALSVWTGRELIVWGGSARGEIIEGGGAYDPGADRWRTLSSEGAPAARAWTNAVWSGEEMIFWGGLSNIEPISFALSGARYEPIADRWTSISTEASPGGNYGFAAQWSGKEMLVYSGARVGPTLSGYSPTQDSWWSREDARAPGFYYYGADVWTGCSLIVWGAVTFNDEVAHGGIYTP